MTPLVLVTVAWVSGILLAQAFSVPPVWLLLSLPCAVTLLLGWGDRRWARRGAAMLIALSLGAGRLLLAQPGSAQAESAQAHVVAYVDSGDIELEGVVVADPDRRAMDTRLQIAAVEIGAAGKAVRNVGGQILLIVPAYTDVKYGDRIRVSGSLTLPPIYDTFSYRDYLARQGIYALLRSDYVDVVASHQANPVLDRLLQFRTRAHSVAQTLLPEPQGSLLAGILLGIEQGIPKDLVEAFELTGTSHIVAISGFNLSLIAALVSRLSRYITKRRAQLPITWLVIWTYALLVGASPAVLRAGVMASLAVLALQEQRKVHGPTSLAGAVMLLSLVNPLVLWDLGFQLSLAAMTALILYVPLLTLWLARPLEWLVDRMPAESVITVVADVLIVTVAVQMMTLGITINTFGK
ncbi:MAG: ComEC/Rec2 family competence protein, partial [Anaerolineae bacterium]|nr:ComEC/Rec2 family competence protein [Anaerolineae bacterium]